jgi:DNA processing protein
MAEKLSEKLVEYGFTIISGLARGIDTVAHRAALEAEGRTIAVLGSGLNVIYPPENYQLVAEIAQRGAVISEFSLQTPPYRNHFPRRNRIIAGFSLGTVVVEAGEKSGSLITANYALEQGREVFAVPGNTTSLLSKGTNNLIKQGAKLVAEVEDIIEELRIYLPDLKKEKREKKIILTEEEERVYQVLTEEPKHIEQIVQEINAPVNKILGVLMRLELKKLVKQQPGKFFSR